MIFLKAMRYKLYVLLYTHFPLRIFIKLHKYCINQQVYMRMNKTSEQKNFCAITTLSKVDNSKKT